MIQLTHLVEVWRGFTLSNSIEVLHIDQLVWVHEARVGYFVLWPLCHMRQVTQSQISVVSGKEGGREGGRGDRGST